MGDCIKFALEKQFNIAHQDTGQDRRGANFILAWWNAKMLGGFDFIDLANVDPHIAEDIATISTFLARKENVVHPYGYRSEIERIISRRRPQAEAA